MKPILLLLCCASPLLCAIPSTSVWEINASATAANVNGGAFDYANVNFPTTYTATGGTGNSSIISGAAYSFVTAGPWVYIKTSGNWGPSGTVGCFWEIASVSAGAATLNTAIGQGVCIDATKGYPTPKFVVNTVAGAATTASPTGGTIGIDYSRSTAAFITFTDLIVGVTTTEVTSTLNPAGVNWIGNTIHLNSGSGCTANTTAWLNVTNVVSTTATLDSTAGTAASVCAAKLGGALSMNSTLDDDVLEKATATNGTGGNRWFVKNSITFGESVSITAAGGTQAPIIMEGYVTLRGDAPLGATRPLITNNSSGALTFGVNWDAYYISFTGTSASSLTIGTSNKLVHCKSVNTSTTVDRVAITAGSQFFLFAVEAISYRGTAINLTTGIGQLHAVYAHDSNIGITSAAVTSAVTISDSIIEGNVTNGFIFTTAATAAQWFNGVTFYGTEPKAGTCLSFLAGTTNVRVTNSIFYGCATGVSHGSTQGVAFSDYNDMFNNTADVSAAGQWQKGANTLAVNPEFVGVGTYTHQGTVTTTTNVLTDSTANFASVVDNQDFLVMTAGATCTTPLTNTKVLITAHTATTLTVGSAPGTPVNLSASGTCDTVTYWVNYGHNFAVGTALKSLGFPGTMPAGLSVAYNDIGGVSRQEAGTGGQTGVVRVN